MDEDEIKETSVGRQTTTGTITNTSKTEGLQREVSTEDIPGDIAAQASNITAEAADAQEEKEEEEDRDKRQ